MLLPMTIINAKFSKEQLHALLALSLYRKTVFILLRTNSDPPKIQVMKKSIWSIWYRDVGFVRYKNMKLSETPIQTAM
jgi:hypothetical protein